MSNPKSQTTVSDILCYPISPEIEYDAIIVLTGGIIEAKKIYNIPDDLKGYYNLYNIDGYDLPFLAEMKAESTKILIEKLYERGEKLPHIILSGADILGPEHPTEPALTIAYMLGSPEVCEILEKNPDLVIMDNKSRETTGSAKNVSEIIAEREFSKMLLLTTSAHAPRAMKAYGNYFGLSGIIPEIYGVSAESILIEESKDYRQAIEDYRHSSEYIKSLLYEAFWRAVLIVDPYGTHINQPLAEMARS